MKSLHEVCDEAVESDLLSRRTADEVLREAERTGWKPSFIVGITGGEPLGEHGERIVEFFKQRGW